MRKKFHGFTLVELIVVIVILGILSTIGYMSFQGYIRDSRDSNRVTSISNIKKGLEINKETIGKYPSPDGQILSGSINNQILVNNGEIGEGMKRILKLSGEIRDPLTGLNYTYGVTSDNSEYQIGSIREGRELGGILIEKAYAYGETAKVEGNYKGILKYKATGRTYASNVPSLIFNNTGSVDLLGTTTYYVINNKENLPYTIKGIKDVSIQKKNSTEIIRELTNTGTAVLTGVDITEIINGSKNVEEIFTGTLLGSFNIRGESLSKTGVILETLNNVIKGVGNGINNSRVVSEAVGCIGLSYSGYMIPNMNHNESQTIQKSITNGTGSIGISCNNGAITYGTETKSCIVNYVVSNGSCVQDICPGSAPSNSQVNGSQSVGGSWSHSTTPGVCTFVCQIGYYWNGSSCVGASAGNYVGSTGLTSQTTCSTGQYQDLTGQSSCKSCSNKPSNSTYTVSTALTSNTCPYSCDSGYYGSGGSCLAFVNGACTGIPSNAQYFNGTASYSLTNANNGTSLSASYNATPTSNTCQYKCNAGYIYSGGNCISQVNPSSLALSHSTRSKTFTFSLTGGSGNGGSCKLQYYMNGNTWTDISGTTYNCDSNISNQSVTLPGDSWNGSWSSIQVRIIRTSDSNALGTFPQNLTCSTTTGSSSSTPNIDEDCNGIWDNTASAYSWVQTSVSQPDPNRSCTDGQGVHSGCNSGTIGQYSYTDQNDGTKRTGWANICGCGGDCTIWTFQCQSNNTYY